MKTSTARAVRFVAAMTGIMAAAVFGDRATADLERELVLSRAVRELDVQWPADGYP